MMYFLQSFSISTLLFFPPPSFYFDLLFFRPNAALYHQDLFLHGFNLNVSWAAPLIIHHYTVSTQQRWLDMFVVLRFRLFLRNEPMHQRGFFFLLHVKLKCFCWCTNRKSGYKIPTVSEPLTEPAPVMFIHYKHGNVCFHRSDSEFCRNPT